VPVNGRERLLGGSTPWRKGNMDFDTGSGSGEFDLSDPIRSFVETVRRVIFSPRDFFRGMPRGGNVLNPLIFAAVCVLIGALMSGVFQEVTQALVAQAFPGMQVQIFFSVNTGFVLTVALAFVGTMIGLVVITGVYQLFVRLIVGRNNGGLGATFRVLCYIQTVLLVVWLPLVNVLALISPKSWPPRYKLRTPRSTRRSLMATAWAPM
jgi:hypothetical protein